MAVNMDLLKKLREVTYAPLKDCKEALVESDGDLDGAVKFLKEKGVLKAGKKADRETSEGIVKFEKRADRYAGIKLLCETDFVAKNEKFHKLVDDLLDKTFSYEGNASNIEELDDDFAQEMKKNVSEMVGTIGENLNLDNVVVGDENVYVYNHPGNKVVAVVFYEGDENIAKEIALQVAAMDPVCLAMEDYPEEQYNELKKQFEKELKDSGKSDDVVEKIMEGKMKKALSEYVLLEQNYIRDGAKKVKDLLNDGFEIKKYLRYTI